MTPVYRRHLRNVQLIGHLEPERRWVFKDSTHLFNLDALLEVYPDAKIVHTHRDPLRVIPSVCSLCWSSRSAMNEGTDPIAFGRSMLDLWDRSIRDTMAVRAKHDPKQFCDLPFEQFVSDPIAAIRDVYTYFGMELTDPAISAIEGYRASNPKGKHGEHGYSLEEWGLDRGEIDERFRSYAEAFDVRRAR